MRRIFTSILAVGVLATACSSTSDTKEARDTTTVPASTSTTARRNYDFAAISPIVLKYIKGQELNGAALVVVDKADGVVYSQAWGEFTPERISLVASSSKMIVAGVLLHLHDQGKLDIDAPVAKVAEWGKANPTITPAQLLSNSSGLVGLFPSPVYAPYLCQYIASGTLQQCAEQIFTSKADDADIAKPDSEFRYGGAQWQVAGAIAEIASGKSWAELIDEIYTKPCGLTALGFNNHFTQLGAASFDYPVKFNSDPKTLAATDNPNMEGGAYVSTGDYAKLLLMQLRGGKCGDTQVLSTKALQRLHEDRIGPAYNGNAFAEGVGYGMGWWVDRSEGRIRDPGAYGAVPWLDLGDGYGAFLLLESNQGDGAALAGKLYKPVETAIKAAR